MLNSRRAHLIRQSVQRQTFGGNIKAWTLSCFGPRCTYLAKKRIKAIAEEGDFLKVDLTLSDTPMYFPKSLNRFFLFQSITEQGFKWQWHYYTTKETPITTRDVVIDCGSAEGLFPVLHHKEAKHIYAIEPLPEYIKALKKTFASISNVTIVEAALGAETKSAYIENNGIASAVTTQKTDTPIKITSLDELCIKRNIIPTYLKADLEGFELEFLKGAVDTIRTHKPKIAITTYHIESHAREIQAFLIDLNPDYKFKTKGISEQHGAPVMLHAWN